MSLPVSGQLPSTRLQHEKPVYPSHKVCKILRCDETTLRRWIREGIPLPDGSRIRIRCIPLGLRNTVFEVEEVERVWLELKAAGEAMSDEIPSVEAEEREWTAPRNSSRKPHRAVAVSRSRAA